jgi:hypothetical protein
VLSSLEKRTRGCVKSPKPLLYISPNTSDFDIHLISPINKMHAPEGRLMVYPVATNIDSVAVTEFMKHEAAKLDAVSDDVDLVNQIKFAKSTAPAFDAAKDKNNFRKYEEACDRVKNFYAVRHPH